MASVTITASFLRGATLSSCSPITARLAKAAGVAEKQKVKINCDTKKEDMGVALLLGLHWPMGRNRVPHPEARKAFASVCVTMPTAKICRR